ncbi:hypothetical protein CERSUDRAFT_59252, partial [Gelatoporia subvermispora B]
VMAEVRAYFQVAYKRVIDVAPLWIEKKFLRDIYRLSSHALIQKLKLGSSSKCAHYLADDPNVARTREEETARKSRLEAIRVELDRFG